MPDSDLKRKRKMAANQRAWLPREVGAALHEAGHAWYDRDSDTYYVRESALDLFRSTTGDAVARESHSDD